MKSANRVSHVFCLLAACAAIASCGDDASNDGGDTGSAADSGSDVADDGALDSVNDTSDADDDVTADGVTDAADDAGADALDVSDGAADVDADGSEEPLPDDCEIVSITPATFEVGAPAEIDIELFCPDEAGDAMKPSFAVLLGGSSGTRCGAQSEEDFEVGTWFRSSVCFDDLVITRELLGRLELSVIGAPGTEPIVSSVGVAEPIDALIAAGGAPTPGIDLDGARPVALFTGAYNLRGGSIALVVDDAGNAGIYRRADGTFAGEPVARTIVGRWEFDDEAGQDTSGLIAPVGGFGSTPFANAMLYGCHRTDESFACDFLPISDGGFGEAMRVDGPEGIGVHRVLDVLSVASARESDGNFGWLEVLAVAQPARGVPGIWRFAMSPAGVETQELDLPSFVETSIVEGGGTANLVRTSKTAAAGPEFSTTWEIWTCTAGREPGTNVLTAGRWDAAGGIFATNFQVNGCGGWTRGNVTAVRGADGKIGHVVADSYAGGHVLRYFPPGSVGTDAVTLELPEAVSNLVTHADVGLMRRAPHVRGDESTDSLIVVTLDVAMPVAMGGELVGNAVLEYETPDASALRPGLPNLRRFALAALPADAGSMPPILTETALLGSEGPALAVEVGDDTVQIEPAERAFACGDRCLEKVSDVICGDTDHFLTVQVGGETTAATFEVVADDGSPQRISLPVGATWTSPPTTCVVDDDGGIWLVGEVSSVAGALEPDRLMAVPVALAGARPRQAVWIDLGGPLRGSQLLAGTPGIEKGTAVLVGYDDAGTQSLLHTVSFAAVREASAEGTDELGLEDVLLGEPVSLAAGVTPPFGRCRALPGYAGRLEPVASGLPTWFWQTWSEEGDSCVVSVEGGAAPFVASPDVSVRDSAATCEEAPTLAVAGNFGLGVGPIRVAPATAESGPVIATIRLGRAGLDEQVLTLLEPVSPNGMAVMPHIVAADFNGDALTDLFVAVPGASGAGVLFADGNGGWLRPHLTEVPALIDLEGVYDAAPGIAGRSVYGAEGYRVESLRRSTRTTAD